MRERSGGSSSGALLGLLAALFVALAFSLAACGADDSSEEPRFDQALVTENLSKASYVVADAEIGQGQLPSLVDGVGFATGTEAGYEGAIQVSGNGLKPISGTDLSQTGFVLFYESADKAEKVDSDIGSGEGQQREGNALFMYGGGVDTPPAAFDEMIGAATGQ